MKNLIIASLLIGTSFLGCRKELIHDESALTTLINGFSSEKNTSNIFLTSIQSFYNSADGTKDTQKIEIKYDDQKRVIAIKDVKSLGNNFQYKYWGNQSQPYLSIVNSENFSEQTYHYYDEQGRVIKDSSIITEFSYQAKLATTVSIQTFEYGNKKLMGQRLTRMQNESIYSIDTSILDNNGNVLLNKKYRHDGTEYVLDVTSAFSYDGHNSPFAGKSIFMAHQAFPFGQSSFFEKFFPQNVLIQKEETADGFSYNEKNSYTYNTVGLPAMMTTINGSDTTRTIYTYAPL